MHFYRILIVAAEKNPRVFGDVEPPGSLFFHELPEVFVSVQKDLILISMAGEDVFDERLRLIQLDMIFISPAEDGRKPGL